MLSFAGQTLATPTPAIIAIMERWWERARPDLWTFPGYNLNRFGYLPIPSPPEPEPAKLNVLCWPDGASRWPVFHGLCGQEQAVEILATVNTDSPTPQTLLISDEVQGTEVSTSMYLIGMEPVFTQGDTGKLWWIRLVGPQYFWWQPSGGLHYTFAPGDTWATLLTNLVTAASGLTPTVPAVPAAYGKPSPLRWTAPAKPLPLLIDAAAVTVGLRFVLHLDGTCEYLTATDGNTADEAQFNDNLASVVYGGRNDVTDISGNIPASVVVSSWGDKQELTTKTLAGLALADYGIVTGVAGKSAWIMGDRYAGQTSPTASAYATQAATDYYGWALGLTDAVFRGIIPMEPTGQEDRIEWEYVPGIWSNVKPPSDDVRGVAARDLESMRLPWERLTTRIVRSNWADRNLYGDRFPPGFTYPIKLTEQGTGGHAGAWKAIIRTTMSGSIADGPKLGFGDDDWVLYTDPASATPAVGTLGTAIPDPLMPNRWIFEPEGPTATRVVTNVCINKTFTSGFLVDVDIIVEYTNPDGTTECVTNPVGCCPVPSGCEVCAGASIPTSIWLNLVSGGCSQPPCVISGAFLIEGTYPIEMTFRAAVHESEAGWCTPSIGLVICEAGTNCDDIGVCMYCLDDAFVVDVTRDTLTDCSVSAGPVTHTALPVTVSTCEPFCATFTVPADAVCDSDTVYRISADPAATCGSTTCDRVRTPLGTGSTSAIVASGGTITLTIPGVTVPAGSFIIVEGLVASLASLGNSEIDDITFAGTSLTVLVDQDNGGIGATVDMHAYIRGLIVPSTTTGSVVITGKSLAVVSATVALLANISCYTGASCASFRWSPPDGFALASNADTGSAATTASVSAPQALMAAMAYFDVSPPADGSPGGGFTGGQVVTLSVGSFGGTVELRELYQIITANGTYDASTPETHDIWVACGVGE